jgi:stress response protein SCP2
MKKILKNKWSLLVVALLITGTVFGVKQYNAIKLENEVIKIAEDQTQKMTDLYKLSDEQKAMAYEINLAMTLRKESALVLFKGTGNLKREMANLREEHVSRIMEILNEDQKQILEASENHRKEREKLEAEKPE